MSSLNWSHYLELIVPLLKGSTHGKFHFFELSRFPSSRLLVNHNINLNTKNNSLPAEILSWTQMRAWLFWRPSRQSLLWNWYATRVDSLVYKMFTIHQIL
ncbi:hypothetical protein Y032_0116g554 [Ancylostoma ceylanicum]|uniref:Uncharacterized protein n=1 Tax=Ancylostoma ceylanicum TaxID=53326 RepID=A0A016TC99_9BILA|nr:hypothetical protein Y032_0116g554 [Ancylostoma ceylanicum]